MLRTFNYTKRKKIPKECVRLSITKAGDQTHFNAVIKIEQLDLQSDARVYIEAYYGPTLYRFDFGSVSLIKQPESTDISELYKISDKCYFRIKIVDGPNGLILAQADKLDLSDDESKNRASIFYVHEVKIETGEIWKMNFDADGDGTPVLELNRDIEGIRDLVRTNISFRALVFPAAIRQILFQIAEQNNFDREGDSWTSKWIVFIEDGLGVTNTPTSDNDSDKLDEWYDEVVRAFCLRNRIFEQYSKNISQ